jgi:hypothetical protein
MAATISTPVVDNELLRQRILYVVGEFQQRTRGVAQPISLERTREILAEIIARPVDTVLDGRS